MNTMAFHPILGVLTEVFLEPGDLQGVKKVVEIFNIFQNENQMTGSRTLPYIPHVKHYSWKRQKNPFRVSDSDSEQFGCPLYNKEQNKPTICLFMKQNRGTLRCLQGSKTIQPSLELLHVFW